MKFGISTALIAFAFMGVANCYVARINCKNDYEQTGYCRRSVEESFEKGASTISVLKPVTVISFFYVSKIFDCPLFESEFRQIEGCEKCDFAMDSCEEE